ncbi:hypothetical protein [Streptomyces sp. GD-15H]|uniref:hypothetical protein n=1 Tax=Streptomyces sp. GD-15H TaxID=3129112 RepID=UPI0038739FA9
MDLLGTMCVDATTIRPATAVAVARETTRAFLEALRQPAVDSEVADTVVLVVSELVTHALRHGGGTQLLRLTAHPHEAHARSGRIGGRTSRLPELRSASRARGGKTARSTTAARRRDRGHRTRPQPTLQLLRQRIIDAHPGFEARDVALERGFEQSYPGLQSNKVIDPPRPGPAPCPTTPTTR